MSAGLVPFEGYEGESSPGLSPSFWCLLAVFGIPWPVPASPQSLSSSSHEDILAGCLSVTVSTFPIYFILLSFIVLLSFLGPHPRHMEVPRLGVESELQPPACATATTTSDLSRICDIYHSSRQHRILNPLSKARNRIHNLHNLMVPSPIC